AGMLEAPAESEHTTHFPQGRVQVHERIARNEHPLAAIWIQDQHTLAEALEREIFNLGWNVQLISAPDFADHELATAAKVLHAAGAVAIFSLPIENPGVQQSVRGIYGDASFLDATALQNRGADAITEVLYWLQRFETDISKSGEQQ